MQMAGKTRGRTEMHNHARNRNLNVNKCQRPSQTITQRALWMRYSWFESKRGSQSGVRDSKSWLGTRERTHNAAALLIFLW